MSKTAVEIDIEKREAQRNEADLNWSIREFIKRYEPEDRRHRLDFEMQLHSIVRAIYREAQDPFSKALRDAVIASPQFMSAGWKATEKK